MSNDSSIMDDIIEAKEKESDYAKVVAILLDNRFKRRKTILTNAQVPKITTLDVIATLYRIVWLKRWCNTYGESRTSGDGGKGRNDIVEISKFHYMEMKKERDELINALRSGK